MAGAGKVGAMAGGCERGLWVEGSFWLAHAAAGPVALQRAAHAQLLKRVRVCVCVCVCVEPQVMTEAGVRVPYRVGTMIEVPRAALQAASIAKTAEFFSFGTNDLTQMT